jgi:hypothetical protein
MLAQPGSRKSAPIGRPTGKTRKCAFHGPMLTHLRTARMGDTCWRGCDKRGHAVEGHPPRGPKAQVHRSARAQHGDAVPHVRDQPNRRSPIRKGATRHGSPLLEVRSPCDEFPRRLAVWMRIRRIHYDRLCLDFEPRFDGGLIQPLLLCATRFGAMHSPSGSLLTPRVSFWTHWRSFDRHVPCAVVVSLDLKVSRYRRFA